MFALTEAATSQARIPLMAVIIAVDGNFWHKADGERKMASMNISLPDPMQDYVQERVDGGQYDSASDYVRDLIRRDQGGIEDEERWLRELDVSISDSLAEMKAGRGVDLDDACNKALAEIEKVDGASRI